MSDWLVSTPICEASFHIGWAVTIHSCAWWIEYHQIELGQVPDHFVSYMYLATVENTCHYSI